MTEKWNVDLPGGLHALIATPAEITVDERYAIVQATSASQLAILAWQRQLVPILRELTEARTPEEVALEFDLNARARKLDNKAKTDLTQQAAGRGEYRELPIADRQSAQLQLQLSERHARLKPAQREEAALVLESLENERENSAWQLAFTKMSKENQDAITRHQRVRVVAFLRAWDLIIPGTNKAKPIPTTPEECGSIPDKCFEPLFEACADMDVDDLATEKTVEALTDPKASGDD